MEKFKISVLLNCEPKKVFKAWLDSKKHSEFTGDKALVEAKTNGKHSAFNGYCWGKTLEITPYKRIIQTWRTTDFDDKDKDSIIELTFTDKNEKTLLTLSHTNIPDGQGDNYKKGWKEYYFTPMKSYFSN